MKTQEKTYLSRIVSLQYIALTFEEVIFFRNNVPDLYDKIK